MEHLKKNHDLGLPDWGPYKKKYIGISHLPDKEKGFRFDLSVFPGFYRRKVDVPNVMWESDYHPWEATPDLSYYAHRHELEWKDRVYCDISFSEMTSSSRLIRCECVNKVNRNQNIVLHYMASLHFPLHHAHAKDFLRPSEVSLPKEGIWIDALDYDDLTYAIPRPTDQLVPDGFFRSEIRDNYFTNGSGIGHGFGNDQGDKVSFRFTVHAGKKDAMLVFRYRLKQSAQATFNAQGIIDRPIVFDGGNDFETKNISLGELESGTHQLQLISDGNSPIELDGFAIVEKSEDLFFQQSDWSKIPDIELGPVKK